MSNIYCNMMHSAHRWLPSLVCLEPFEEANEAVCVRAFVCARVRVRGRVNRLRERERVRGGAGGGGFSVNEREMIKT